MVSDSSDQPLPTLCDSHCHLADERILYAADELCARAAKESITRLVVNGTCEGDWGAVLELARTRSAVIPSLGLHPWHVAERSSSWLSHLEALLEANPRAGVGEVGLHVGSSRAPLEEQLLVLREQLLLAARLGRVVSLHCVGPGASEAVVVELAAVANSLLPARPVPVVMHWFSCSSKIVPTLAALGCYFSFNAACAGTAGSSKRWKAVPRERLLVETDAPDGLPKDASGDGLVTLPGCGPLSLTSGRRSCGCGAGSPHTRLNTPASLPGIVRMLGMLLAVDERELRTMLNNNASRLWS